jgi:hypothetical protein
VDETLEISRGPVTFQMLMELKQQGHIVGIIGNWAGVTRNVLGWHNLISFIGTFGEYHEGGVRADKTGMMIQLKMYIPAEDYVMVGNILGVSGMSDDKGSAERAGWRFIQESLFAAGER